MQINVARRCDPERGDPCPELRRGHPRNKSDVLLALLLVHDNELINGLGVARIICRGIDEFLMVSAVDGELRGRHAICAGPTLPSFVSLDRRLHDSSDERLWRAAKQLFLASADHAVACTADTSEDKLTLESAQRIRYDVIALAFRKIHWRTTVDTGGLRISHDG